MEKETLTVFCTLLLVALAFAVWNTFPFQERVITRAKVDKCAQVFNAKLPLAENLSEYWINMDSKDVNEKIESLQVNLEMTNQKYNKLQALVGCVLDR